MSELFEFREPIRVTAGTVGQPGQRVFYLQAREGAVLLTMKAEKQQVGALGQHIGELLQDLVRPGHIPEDEELELEDFVEPLFEAGAIGVAYDSALDRVILLVEERVRDESIPREARFALTREQAAALAIRSTRLVESGRPPCPLCGFPLDARGHACPRTNGHHAPTT